MASRNGIADALRTLILSGELKPGDKLPSSRDLIARYGGGKETALAAIRVLDDEGLVATEDRRRAVVRDRNDEARPAEVRLAETADDLRGVLVKISGLRDQLADVEKLVIAALSRANR
ncbi:winged helix-turn-helix domain-containing protein [Amycolatopsis sp. FDAARGOS 1241]|uniref:winged helix-turn-helix domain-containing protein n=1 Tax=Amycolatopsis sp. FDAARGOS 1241 TaxID=2778070 RepID=UPI00195197AF|nr:winged helix-turn-helix domain-containing protein [Amycolatopsis sp. FDAARGOS 1241]QRP47233.1 winged helix-turn-helix transcriptional regulator [Amycolatopsis sp. FDAARGOS 1241]